MKALKIKQFSELNVTVIIDSDCVKTCYRKVVLTDLSGNHDYDITLNGDDALIPLKVGQHVLANLLWDHISIDEWKDSYLVLSFKPLDENAKIEFVED